MPYVCQKIIFLPAKGHMHIFSMLITFVQCFKLIAWKHWEELITQTCYPTLKANLKTVLSRKCRDFVKNYLFACKTSYAHFQYIRNKYAQFQNQPLKTVSGFDYTNSIPYNAKSCLKCPFTVYYTNSIPYNSKSCLKWLSSKGCNSVKIISSSTKNPHAHFQHVHNRYAKFQKDPLKTVGGVDYTNSIP